MAYEVVARRWRPLTFDSVVGQKHVTATLATAIERERVAHAFLFTGIRGVGKTTVARLLARALNCTDRKGSEPCNECSSCKQILSGSSVDVLEIDGASNRGIDEVRSLIEAAAYRPAGGRYRIYIIDEVHQLTREAFNALLKILEEPPSHVKFVLATTEPHKLPQTVLSRCQRYDFRRLTSDEIVAQLAHIAKKDKLAVDKDALALIAREADGSMRDAQSLLEQVVATTGGKATGTSVSEILGVAGTDLLIGCVEAILQREPARIVSAMADIRRTGVDTERFLNEVLEVVRHVSVARAAGKDAIGASAQEAIRDCAERLKEVRDPLDLQRIFSSLLRTAEDLRRGAMPELVLEMGLLKAAMLESVSTAAEVLARLDRAGTGGTPGDSGPRGRATSPASRASSPPPRPTQRSAESGGVGAAVTAAATRLQDAVADEPPPVGDLPGANVPGHALAHSANPTTSRSAAGKAAHRSPEPAHVSQPFPAEGDHIPSPVHWEGFLQFVRDEAGFDLYVTLTNCEVVKLEAERIELRAMLDGFRRRLESQETLSKLRDLATRHFRATMTVGVVGIAGAAGGLSVRSIEAERTVQLEERALSDPLIRGALDVLGGKVGKISRIDE